MKPAFLALPTAATLAVFLTACGGDSAETTAAPAAPAAETTVATAPATEATTGAIGGIGDIPPECVEIAASFLQQLEPIVSTIDWQSATLAEFEQIQTEFEAISASFDEAGAAAGCDQIAFADDAQAVALLTQLASDVAPGTLPFLAFLTTLSATASSGAVGVGLVSGDCETDIATFEGIIAEGGTLVEKPVSEVAEIGQLVTAIGTECPPERANEVLTDPAVTAFLSGISG